MIPLITLYCLPSAGSSSHMYKQWQEKLPSFIGVQAIELSGRGRRFSEPLLNQFDMVVDEIFQQVVKNKTTRFAFFGHSMGGLLAYGVSIKLFKSGLPLPEQLFISACASPTNRKDKRFDNLDSRDALIADLRKHQGTPEEVYQHAELLDLMLNILRADYSVCRSFTYQEHSPLVLPIHVFAGSDDSITLEQHLAWQNISQLPIQYNQLPGGHFYLHAQLNQLLNLIKNTCIKTCAIAS